MTTGAEQGEIAEVGSPVRIAADPIDGRGAFRWTTVTIGVATLFLAIANAHAIGGWIDDATPNAATERLRGPVGGWVRLTAAAGLDAPRAAVARWWTGLHAKRFGSEQPGEQGAN